MTDMIYLARPIDQAWPDGGDAKAKEILKERFAVYDPGSGWSTEASGDFIQRVNDVAIETADGVFAILHDGVASVGVPIEIERAAAAGKPVVVWGGEAVAKSPVLAGISVPVYTDLLDAIEALHSAIWLRKYGVDELSMDVSEYLELVRAEIERARLKHPKSDDATWTTLERWFAIWAEEIFEVMQAWNDRAGPEQISGELVQVGAMSMRLWRAVRQMTGEDPGPLAGGQGA